MRNSTWACFDCRETVRRSPFTREAVRCPSCSLLCRYVAHKLRMPPKRNVKAWAELLIKLQEDAIANAEEEQLLRLERVRKIRAEIDRLEELGPNEGRAKQIGLLRRQLAKL